MSVTAKPRDSALYSLIPRCITVSFAFVGFDSFYLIPRLIDTTRLFWPKIYYIQICRRVHSNTALNAATNFVGPYIFGHSWDNDGSGGRWEGWKAMDEKWTFLWTSHVAVIYACQSQYVLDS